MGIGKGAAAKKVSNTGTVSNENFELSTANQVVTFPDPLNSITITAEGNPDDFHVKFNGEDVEHLVTSVLPLNVDDMKIQKITIVESGKNFMYDGLF